MEAADIVGMSPSPPITYLTDRADSIDIIGVDTFFLTHLFFLTANV